MEKGEMMTVIVDDRAIETERRIVSIPRRSVGMPKCLHGLKLARPAGKG